MRVSYTESCFPFVCLTVSEQDAVTVSSPQTHRGEVGRKTEPGSLPLWADALQVTTALSPVFKVTLDEGSTEDNVGAEKTPRVNPEGNKVFAKT